VVCYMSWCVILLVMRLRCMNVVFIECILLVDVGCMLYVLIMVLSWCVVVIVCSLVILVLSISIFVGGIVLVVVMNSGKNCGRCMVVLSV